MAPAIASSPRQHDGVVARLVEAERVWKARLDEARQRAAALEQQASEAASRAERQAVDDSASQVEARTRELRAATAAIVEAARGELTARTARYDTAPPELIDRVAAKVASRAPWLVAHQDGGP
jgi:hypothetical protein